MAKRRFRIESLSPQEQAELRSFFQYVNPDFVLDEIERTGTIPESVKSGLDSAQISSLNRILSKLPTAQETYQKYIDQGTDKEADLTDEELQTRIEAFKGLNISPGKVRKPDIQKLANEIKRITLGGVKHLSGKWLDKAAPEIAEDFLNNRFSQQRFAELIQNASGGEVGQVKAEELKNFGFTVAQQLNERVGSGEFSFLEDIPGRDTSEDIKRIQDILESRGIEARKAGEFQNFLVKTPAELEALRRGGLAERQGEATKFLAERYGPRVIAELNRFGLAEGPDVASLVAAKAGELQGGIEDVFRQMEAEDNAFFAEAAFRLHTSKLEQSEAAFRTSVGAERELLRLGQSKRFEKGQRDIQREFELALLQREANRNVALKKSELQIGKEISASDLTSGLVSDIASNTAQIVGGKIIYGAKGKEGPQPSPRFDRLG